MGKLGFANEDFALFRIPGFEERMEAIAGRIRPRLVEIGEELQAEMLKHLGVHVFPHVAKHARRTVNPPDETWVAFGPSKKAYKKFGYMALVISEGGIHTRVVVKDENEDRLAIASAIRKKAKQLPELYHDLEFRDYDGWDYRGLPKVVEPNAQFWVAKADRLDTKLGVLDVGTGWPIEEARSFRTEEILSAFEALLPLYKLTVNVSSVAKAA
ncbi:MAG: hypothetical protein GMKNLPBB_00389 [Myxococcota bacterium]|nr:hypothetical protein [Myxococcota bacterium]